VVSLTERIGGRFLDGGGAVINALHPQFGARYDARGRIVNGSEVIQAAWEQARETGRRVYLPAAVYQLTLTGDASRGYGPALLLRGARDKEASPLLEGESRGTVLEIAFPGDAPRDLEVIRLVRAGTDNQRGMGIRNFRLVNTNEPRGGRYTDPIDYHGCGIRIASSWTGQLLDNFQVRGFYQGVNYANGYFSRISNGEIRNCNFGLDLAGAVDGDRRPTGGVPNGNTFESIILRAIRKVRTVPDWIDAARYPEGIVGAGVNGRGGTVSACTFIGCGAEQCGAVGIYIGGGTALGWTFIGWRSESVQAPVWIQGPVPAYVTPQHTFINPYFSCGRLEAPVFRVVQGQGISVVSPYFHGLPDDQLAGHFGPNARVTVDQPRFSRPHESGDDRRWFLDESTWTRVRWTPHSATTTLEGWGLDGVRGGVDGAPLLSFGSEAYTDRVQQERGRVVAMQAELLGGRITGSGLAVRLAINGADTATPAVEFDGTSPRAQHVRFTPAQATFSAGDAIGGRVYAPASLRADGPLQVRIRLDVAVE
jgi:hypothetical protein